MRAYAMRPFQTAFVAAHTLLLLAVVVTAGARSSTTPPSIGVRSNPPREALRYERSVNPQYFAAVCCALAAFATAWPTTSDASGNDDEEPGSQSGVGWLGDSMLHGAQTVFVLLCTDTLVPTWIVAFAVYLSQLLVATRYAVASSAPNGRKCDKAAALGCMFALGAAILSLMVYSHARSSRSYTPTAYTFVVGAVALTFAGTLAHAMLMRAGSAAGDTTTTPHIMRLALQAAIVLIACAY